LGDFELDTRLEAVDPAAGRFRARLVRDWEIWGPNGGYVAAIALRAAGCVSRIPRPASLSAHFLRVAEFAPVEVEVAPLRLGRRSESLRVSIRQDGKPVLEALVRTAADGPGLEHVHSGFLAPNLDVTAWFHALAPDCEWLLADHVSPVARGGLMGTVGRVWSRDGRLLASGGAQLFCVARGSDG
jgi:acyl-CoA thioesterase